MSAGNLEAIRDWSNGTYFSKIEIADIYLSQKGKSYDINITGGANSTVIISEKDFPERTFTVVLNQNGSGILNDIFVEGTSITISSNGYETKEITLGSTTSINVTLEIDFICYDSVKGQELTLSFVTQYNGRNNSSTYKNDKYIRLYNITTNQGESIVYSSYKIDIRNYTKAKIRFKLVSDHSQNEYKFRIGLDNNQVNQGHITYHTWYSGTFQTGNDIQEYVLDLTQQSIQSLTTKELYLRIGSVQDVYIYGIELE